VENLRRRGRRGSGPGVGLEPGRWGGLLFQVATFQAIDRLRRQARWDTRLAWLMSPLLEEEVEEAHELEAWQVEAARELALLPQGECPEVLAAARLHFLGSYTLEVSGRTVARMLGLLSGRARKRGRAWADWGPSHPYVAHVLLGKGSQDPAAPKGIPPGATVHGTYEQ